MNKWLHEKAVGGGKVTQLPAFGCPGTHIAEDGEGFGQSFAQQADPFGEQLVQMFPKMLAKRDHG